MQSTPPRDGPVLVVLAAGMGSRYGGVKQIDPIGPSGEIMLDYAVYDAVRAGFTTVVFVIRRDLEAAFREHVGARFEGVVEVAYAFQELDTALPPGMAVPAERSKPWGTAHAVLACREVVERPFCVINADDFYGRHAFELMSSFLGDCNAGDMAMVGYRLAHTLSDHGSVSRGICRLDNDRLQEVVERTDIVRRGGGVAYRDDSGQWCELRGDEIVSLNFWGFTPSFFDALQAGFAAFLQEHGAEAGAEFFIPAEVDRLVRSGAGRVHVFVSNDQWFGVTYAEDKPGVVAAVAGLTRDGVYPMNIRQGLPS